MGGKNYHGHMTLSDGTHVPLTAEDAQRMIEASDANKRRIADTYPELKDCLRALGDVHSRLMQLGWRDSIYCPKDGSEFAAIEFGSTGIHRCHYAGEWPSGSWMIAADGDLWPSRPIVFKVFDERSEGGCSHD